MATAHAEIKVIVREAVSDTLLAFGIDVSEPEGVVRFQKDMHYLRDLRLQSEENKSNVIRKGLELIAAGLAAALFLGVFEAVGIFRG